MQGKLEQIKIANEEITKKKSLVQDLKLKYPDLNINPEVIVKCDAGDVQRLIQLLLFDDKLAKAALKIQTYYRMRKALRNLQEKMRVRLNAKIFIARVWKSFRWRRLYK